MVKLANIFDTTHTGGPRGADLRVEACVRRKTLGLADGVLVDVPLEVEGLRRADPHGDGRKVRVRLPAELPPEGAMLRLRGLGGAVTAEGDEAEAAGDLYLHVTVEEGDASAKWPFWVLGLAGAIGAAAALLSVLG